MRHLQIVQPQAQQAQAQQAQHEHRAYAADYCPLCGTAREIGGSR
jgi:hypothetical protein